MSPEQFVRHVAGNTIDLEASPVWLDDVGGIVAASLLGVRGERGWIGGFGVAPDRRGSGLGAGLLGEVINIARALGLTTLTLECLIQNAAALALYERAGFKKTRTLHTADKELQPAVMPPAFVSTDPELLLDWPVDTPPCWQREPVSLRVAPANAVSDGGQTFAVFHDAGNVAQMHKAHAPDAAAFAELTQAFAAGGSFGRLVVFNEPIESALWSQVRAQEWTERLVQHEMVLAL